MTGRLREPRYSPAAQQGKMTARSSTGKRPVAWSLSLPPGRQRWRQLVPADGWEAVDRARGEPAAAGDVVGGQFDLNRMLVQTWGMFTRYPRVIRAVAQWAEVLDLVAAIIAASLIAVIYLNRVGPGRIVLALGFIFFVPGRAIVANWPRMARWSEAAMPIVISLTVTGLMAMVALWVHLWRPLQIFEIEALLSLAALVLSITRRRRLGLFEPGYDQGNKYPGQRQIDQGKDRFKKHSTAH